MTSQQLRLYLFGRFRLERSGHPLHLPTIKIELLLAYLVLHPELHSREKLAALLWGDFSDAQARASLRNALAALRKLGGPDLLLTDRLTIQLNPDYPLWVDVWEFKKLEDWQRPRTSQKRELPPDSSSPNSESLIALYQGDLLANFYDEWLGPERETYQSLYFETLLQLARQRQSQGEYEAAITYAQQLLNYDATYEVAHQTIMACYLTLGNRTAALKQYETCRRLLRDELDVEPQPDTTALYERIKRADAPASVASLTNLPTPLTRFIGRESVLAEIKQLLIGPTQPDFSHPATLPTRLLTLLGPGGSGKTRLAIQTATVIARQDLYPEGIWWVELASVTDPTFVPQAVAKALGLRPSPDQPLNQILIDYLRPRRLLLILDNCEQVIIACAHLTETLLLACYELQILATSREALGLIGEVAWPVPPLSLPELADENTTALSPTEVQLLAQTEAIRLFVDRAMAAQPDFSLTNHNAVAIAQICRRLEGLPLAIELAAAQVRGGSVQQIAARLLDRLALLGLGSRSVNMRHQTLRAALDWSYELLTPAEQVLFRRLAVFVGGFTLEAAAAICAGEAVEQDTPLTPLSSSAPLIEVITSLVNKSLLTIEHRIQDTRYQLLEPIRHYAADKLWLAGEEQNIWRRHLHWFAALAVRAEPELLGANQLLWLDRLEQDHPNLSAALRFAAEGEKTEVEAGLRLGGALWWFWGLRGYNVEGRERLRPLLSQVEASLQTEAKAKGLFSAGMLALYQMDGSAAMALLQESQTLWQALDHSYGLALTWQYLGFMAHRQGQPAVARQNYEAGLALWRQLGNPWGLGETLGLLGNLTYWDGNYTAARTLQEESLHFKRQIGEKRGVAFSVWSLGKIAQAQGDYATARTFYSEALNIMHRLENKEGLPFVLEAWGYLAVAEKQFQRAARLFGAAAALREAIGSGLPAMSRAAHERDLAEARKGLGNALFEAAWAEGPAMTLDQIVAYALQEA
jgi:predicted ATPase/DNA-binding SARP family transcriptional activator